MNLFYIPDGHRRYAAQTRCTLEESYREGFRVLRDEILDPLFNLPEIEEVGIFCLSNLNLDRREPNELSAFLETGQEELSKLAEHCKGYASVRTVGTYFAKNLLISSSVGRTITFYVGTSIDDNIDCNHVDLFLRSGGQMRLSGAPRQLIGSYTELISIEKLHPELRFSDISDCFARFDQRYFRSTDKLIAK
ncbi:hypothetical protein GFL92_01095 [Rhizobium leguminosarum bv. viciae]|nr:hypothetical protein [Rhizobium leguminosarum bv. viciae]